MPLRGVVLLTFLVGSLPFCFIRPMYGVLLWAIIAFLSPQSAISYWSFALAFPWAAAVAVATIAGMLVFGRTWVHQAKSQQVLLLLVLWVWFTITTVVSTGSTVFSDHAADSWFRWEFVSKVLFMTFVTIAIVDSFARLRLLVLTIAGCFGVLVLKAVPFMIMTGGRYRFYGPDNSMISDNNDLGLALNMVLPFFFFLAQTETNRWVRRLFGFVFVAAIFGILCTYSRGAVVGLIAVLGILFLGFKQRALLLPVFILVISGVVLFAPDSWKERMDPTRPDAIDGSAMERINAWTFSWHLAADYPITGGGFETFTPALFQRYAPNVTDVRGPHSVYFGVLAEHGFPGLFLYLLLVFSCLTSTSRLIRRARRLGDQRAMDYAKMFRLSLIAFLTSGTFLGRAYFDLYFSIVACIAVLSQVCRSEWARRRALEDDQETREEEFPDVAALAEEGI